MKESFSKARETSRRVRITPLSENVATSSTIWQSHFIAFPLIRLIHLTLAARWFLYLLLLNWVATGDLEAAFIEQGAY
jgi:hypothetical protein